MEEPGYFAGDCAHTGFCGNLDPSFELAHGFSEEDIADFIRAARPDLFKRLNGLPLPSTHLDDTESVSSTASSLFGPRQSRFIEPRSLIPDRKVYSRPGDHQMLDLQHKRFVQLKVLNGYQLILQKLSYPSPSIRCADPRCESSSIPSGTFFVTLSREYRDARYHYCLACLEALFDRRPSPNLDCQLDGKLDSKLEATFPYHFPSNSAEALALRRKRDKEAQDIIELDHLRRTSTPPTTSASFVDSQSPNLTLSRPRDVLPYPARYKKQGRTTSDYGKRKSSDTANTSSLPLSKRRRLHEARGTPYKALICFCREPAGESDLITCASGACMIGTFHLQCLNLKEKIEDGDEVYCMYCAESFREVEAGPMKVVGVDPTESETPSDTEDDVPSTPRSDLDQDGVYIPDPAACGIVEDDALTLPSSPSFHTVNGPGHTATSKTHHTQIDGLMSPVPVTPCLRPISTASLSGNISKAAKPSSAVPLPPGSNRTTFADLAPFIICELSSHSPFGLSSNEAKAVRDWQRFCPRSKLLQSRCGHEANKTRVSSDEGALDALDHGVDVIDGKGVALCKLTELMKCVRTN